MEIPLETRFQKNTTFLLAFHKNFFSSRTRNFGEKGALICSGRIKWLGERA